MRVNRCAKRMQLLHSYICHHHSYWEVVLQLEGTTKTQIDDEEWTVEPGDILVIPPDTPHSGQSEDGFRDIFVIAVNMDFSAPMQLHDYDGSVGILMEMMQKLFLEREGNYLAIADCLCETIEKYLQKLSARPERYPFVAELKGRIYRELSNTDFPYPGRSKTWDFIPTMSGAVSRRRRESPPGISDRAADQQSPGIVAARPLLWCGIYGSTMRLLRLLLFFQKV